MSEREFVAFLKSDLGPVVRNTGFVGDASSWRRIREPFIDCVEIQARSDCTACCVNLGEHLTFLPVARGSSRIDSGNIECVDCEMKWRLAPEGEAEHWWSFEDAAAESARLVRCFRESAELFFEKYQKFPEPFVNIDMRDIDGDAAVELLPMMTKVRRILLVARVYDHLGDGEQAMAWAEFGKEHTGMAVDPKVAFQEIARKYK